MKLNKMSLITLIAISGLTISCTKVYLPDQPSTVNTQVNQTPVTVKDIVSFRVIGNAVNAKVRFSNSVDGLNQVTTTLPFQQTIESTKDNAFFYLEATSNGYPASVSNPFLSVQIVVNGTLFREASTSSIFFDTINTSGTYHR